MCPACIHATTAPRSDRCEIGCIGCKARILACIGSASLEKPGEPMTAEFKRVLAEVFGSDWKAGAAQVKHWLPLIKTHDKKALHAA